MNQPENELPISGESLSPEPVFHKHRGRSRRRGSVYRARLWLVGIFLLLRAYDVFVFVSVPLPGSSILFGSIINKFILTTVLLTAIWFRKGWARYALIFLLAIGVLAALIVLPEFWVKLEDSSRLTVFTVTAIILHAAIAFRLMFSRDLDRLTSRAD